MRLRRLARASRDQGIRFGWVVLDFGQAAAMAPAESRSSGQRSASRCAGFRPRPWEPARQRLPRGRGRCAHKAPSPFAPWGLEMTYARRRPRRPSSSGNRADKGRSPRSWPESVRQRMRAASPRRTRARWANDAEGGPFSAAEDDPRGTEAQATVGVEGPTRVGARPRSDAKATLAPEERMAPETMGSQPEPSLALLL